MPQESYAQELCNVIMPTTTATILLSPTGANNQRYIVTHLMLINSGANAEQVMLYKLKPGESPTAKNLFCKPLLAAGDEYDRPTIRMCVENGDQIVGLVNDPGVVSLFLNGLNVTDV